MSELKFLPDEILIQTLLSKQLTLQEIYTMLSADLELRSKLHDERFMDLLENEFDLPSRTSRREYVIKTSSMTITERVYEAIRINDINFIKKYMEKYIDDFCKNAEELIEYAINEENNEDAVLALFDDCSEERLKLLGYNSKEKALNIVIVYGYSSVLSLLLSKYEFDKYLMRDQYHESTRSFNRHYNCAKIILMNTEIFCIDLGTLFGKIIYYNNHTRQILWDLLELIDYVISTKNYNGYDQKDINTIFIISNNPRYYRSLLNYPHLLEFLVKNAIKENLLDLAEKCNDRELLAYLEEK